MRFLPFLITTLIASTLSAQADQIYLYNVTHEHCSYDAPLPNGDVKKGEIQGAADQAWSQTLVRSESTEKKRTLIVMNDDGKEIARGTFGYYVAVLLYKDTAGQYHLDQTGFTMDKSQTCPAAVKLVNCTGTPLRADLITSRDTAKGVPLPAGIDLKSQIQVPNAGARYFITLVLKSEQGQEIKRFSQPLQNGYSYILATPSDSSHYEVRDVGMMRPPL
jgi:hypothetical protein